MKLSPEYSLVQSSRRIALDDSDYDEAMEKFDQDLPFGNLFGGGVTRLVIPMINSMKYEISGVLGEQGYESVDWQTGEAIKTVLPGPGAPANAQPKIRRDRIGKVLGRLPEAAGLLKWWNENSTTAKTDDFSIVISRHPVDVLRMSDHSGWTSCHTPGREHYKSCIGEMKHGGLVAYLVNTDHLQALSPEQISGKDEIFKDEERDVDGVEPMSRLRLRRFTHEDGEFDLALPEMDIYGQRSTEFKDQVADWARKAQKPIIGENRWRMNEFVRRGGQYRNSGVTDARWFNNFFEDNLDRGDTEYGVEGEEDQENTEALNEERRQEMATVHARWEGSFDHCYINYEEFDNDDDEQPIDFAWSGGINIDVPEDVVEQSSYRSIERDLSKGNDLKEHLNNYGIYFGDGDVGFSGWGGRARFSIDVHDPDGGFGGPDEYQEYCNSVLDDDFERKHDDIQEIIIGWLRINGYAKQTPVREFESSHGGTFDHFEVEILDEDDGEMEAAAKGSIGPYDKELWNEYKFREMANFQIRELVAKEIQRIIQTQKQPQHYLPGFFAPSPLDVREGYNLKNFSVYLSPDRHDDEVELQITFKADDATDEEDMQEIIELITIVDKMFPKILVECEVMLERFYSEARASIRKQYGQGESISPFNLTQDYSEV